MINRQPVLVRNLGKLKMTLGNRKLQRCFEERCLMIPSDCRSLVNRRLVDVLPEKTPKEAPVEALEEARGLPSHREKPRGHMGGDVLTQ